MQIETEEPNVKEVAQVRSFYTRAIITITIEMNIFVDCTNTNLEFVLAIARFFYHCDFLCLNT